MAKSNKSKTLKKGSKKKGKIHNTRKHTRHSKNYIHIDNTGLTKVMYTQGNQSPKKTIFKWDGKYDGKNANIHMNLNVDGKKTHSDLKLSNKDLFISIFSNTVNNVCLLCSDKCFFLFKPIIYTSEFANEPADGLIICIFSKYIV